MQTLSSNPTKTPVVKVNMYRREGSMFDTYEWNIYIGCFCVTGSDPRDLISSHDEAMALGVESLAKMEKSGVLSSFMKRHSQ